MHIFSSLYEIPGNSCEFVRKDICYLLLGVGESKRKSKVIFSSIVHAYIRDVNELNVWENGENVQFVHRCIFLQCEYRRYREQRSIIGDRHFAKTKAQLCCKISKLQSILFYDSHIAFLTMFEKYSTNNDKKCESE